MHCKNCGASLLPNQNYCSECGAKVIKKRLTLKNIWAEINEHFFNVDNKLLNTFITLFKAPEKVIVSYIEGTRKKYVNVMQYFAISLTLVGIQVFLMNIFFEDAVNMDDIYGDKLKNLNTKDNPFSPENFDFNAVNNYQSLIYVLTVPVSAISTWLTCIIVGDKRYNFTEHIVLNLYYSAQIIILTSVLSILFLAFGGDYLTISGLISVATLIYLFYVLHCVFKTTLAESIARFLLLLLMYGAFFVIVTVATVIIGALAVILNSK